MRRKFPTRVRRPSKRSIQAYAAFASGDLAAMPEPKTRKTGPQAEGDTNKEVARWRNLQPNLVLERNKRRLATPPGMTQPIMLGWLMPGSSDWVGWESVTITPDLLGKKVAVFVGLEAKRRTGGRTSDEQDGFLEKLRDDGGIVGIVRSFEDCELARKRWRER